MSTCLYAIKYNNKKYAEDKQENTSIELGPLWLIFRLIDW